MSTCQNSQLQKAKHMKIHKLQDLVTTFKFEEDEYVQNNSVDHVEESVEIEVQQDSEMGIEIEDAKVFDYNMEDVVDIEEHELLTGEAMSIEEELHNENNDPEREELEMREIMLTEKKNRNVNEDLEREHKSLYDVQLFDGNFHGHNNQFAYQNKSFANMVGGVKDWSYTVELQDRGSPHVHFVLRTGKTADQLLAMPDLVVAKIPDALHDPELADLVNRLQIHACGNYCRGRVGCRFGYPFDPNPRAHFDPISNRAVYERDIVDSFVNPYNPYILKLMKVSMDIQVNYSGRGMYYLAKYMSKVDQNVQLEYGMEDITTHFQGRQMGAVDAVYFLSGWNEHRSSRGTVYISVVYPGFDERRQLRRNLDRLDENDPNIFSATHVQKYLRRHRQTFDMTLVEYFTTFIMAAEQDVEDEFVEPTEQTLPGQINRNTINQEEATIFDDRIGPMVLNDVGELVPSGLNRPLSCTDNYGVRYRGRDVRKRIPLWRTHFYNQTSGEPFYYQNVLLYYPLLNIDAFLAEHGNWCDGFFAVCRENNFRDI